MKKLIAFTFFFLNVYLSNGQEITQGTWYNDEKTARFQFFESNGKINGKIVWLKEPNDEKGKPKTDVNNPEAKLRSAPLLGMVIMKGFKKDGDTKWEDGTIYDPKKGKTYSCVITQKSAKMLTVRGYVGISLIGRDSYFTRAE
ncbi:MAG: DUF2147 domain-containing protein [Leadbetterella sp.]